MAPDNPLFASASEPGPTVVRLQDQLAASERRLAAQSNALTELTERHADSTGDFLTRLKTILETAARTLQVDRLSLWRCAPDVRSIRCVDLYNLSSGEHE